MRTSHIQMIKRAVSSCAPPLFRAIRRSRRMLHDRRNSRLQARLLPWKTKFIQQHGFVVQGGPFAGMTFHACAPEQAYLPLLTGSYEAETHGFIEAALARCPATIIDVGCEAGYVAVGLARRAPQARVIGFDIDPAMRDRCRALARTNGVDDRLVVEGECTPARLDALCAGNALVFCDCEGYEYELLDPARVPHLAHADIIVELHDFMRVDVDITATIVARFTATHDIDVVGVAQRTVEQFPSVNALPRDVRAEALQENRVAYQQWAFLRAKTRA